MSEGSSSQRPSPNFTEPIGFRSESLFAHLQGLLWPMVSQQLVLFWRADPADVQEKTIAVRDGGGAFHVPRPSRPPSLSELGFDMGLTSFR